MLNGDYIRFIKSVNDYWANMMPMMAMEELAECTQAISKVERYGCEGIYRDNLIQEFADACIAIDALSIRYKISDKELWKAIQTKLNKTY